MQLAAAQPDGSTLRAHLQAAAAAGARVDARLLSRPPREALALWGAFLDLSAARPMGMTAGAIPPSEVLAWQQLHGVRLSAWEVETLGAMDRAVLVEKGQQT